MRGRCKEGLGLLRSGSKMLLSSAIDGIRQALAGAVVQAHKNTVNTVPSAKLLGSCSQVGTVEPRVFIVHVVHAAAAGWGFSFPHQTPVWWSVTVLSPAHSNVAHTAATVRLVFRMLLPSFGRTQCAVVLASAGGRQIAGLAARFALADLHHDKGLQEVMKITGSCIDRCRSNPVHTRTSIRLFPLPSWLKENRPPVQRRSCTPVSCRESMPTSPPVAFGSSPRAG